MSLETEEDCKRSYAEAEVEEVMNQACLQYVHSLGNSRGNVSGNVEMGQEKEREVRFENSVLRLMETCAGAADRSAVSSDLWMPRDSLAVAKGLRTSPSSSAALRGLSNDSTV